MDLKNLKKHVSNIFLEEDDDIDIDNTENICESCDHFVQIYSPSTGKVSTTFCDLPIDQFDQCLYYTEKADKEDDKKTKSSDQTAKADNGKPKLSLVPRKIIFDIAKVREYGNNKYPEGGPDNWKQVSKERYRDALFRHFMAYLDDPDGVDEESGLPHLSHLACNVAFLCELEDL